VLGTVLGKWQSIKITTMSSEILASLPTQLFLFQKIKKYQLTLDAKVLEKTVRKVINMLKSVFCFVFSVIYLISDRRQLS
jgi:hypothetical protein